ncbi:MAG: MFS transporter [Tepidisphaeraceae bacterium]|jgi:predicted MFS family arabinose efflux permease
MVQPIPYAALFRETPEHRRGYRNLAIVMACGIFVSTFSQVGVLGLYPLRFLLKDRLHEGPVRVALFMQLANMPWNLKILSGIIVDGMPLLGSRRRYYLLLSSIVSGALWLAVGLTPAVFWPLLVMATLMNIALVFVSTVSGGLLVEGGQKYGATGKLSALRVAMMNVAGLGISAGALVAHRMGVSAVIAAVPMFLMFFLTFYLYHEERVARTDPNVWKGLWEQLKIACTSPMLWITSGLLFLVQFAPGFVTPLMFYQTDTLGFSDNFISLLALVDAVAGAVGAVFYGYFCRRVSLRVLLYASISITAGASLFYLGYVGHKSAVAIEAIYYLVYYLAQLPLYDLAVRATPRGSEALGYSIIMSVWNWGLFFSDIIGSYMFEKWHVSFMGLVWINAATTALVLVAVPFLPRLLVDVREGEASPPA